MLPDDFVRNQTLAECTAYVNNCIEQQNCPNLYTSFVYDFKNQQCFPKTTIRPILPWSGPGFFPGALFIPKESEYYLVTTEGTTCEDLDMNFIMNSSDCLNAAEALHLIGRNEVHEQDDTDRPQGCYMNTNGGLNIAMNGLKGTQIKYQDNDAARFQICQKK